VIKTTIPYNAAQRVREHEVSDPTADILMKRKEAQMLADVLPESLERFQLQQRIWACDHALDLLKSGGHEGEPSSVTSRRNTE